MRVIIVEDELLSAEKLKSMLKKTGFEIEIIGSFQNISDTKKFLMINEVDLIFLDIQLDDGLSFEIFEEININTPIIFTTAYHDYAIKAFELNSIDYLLKPIKQFNLNKAIQKFSNLKVVNNDYRKFLEFMDNKKYKKRFLLNIGQKLKTVNVDEVAYIYAEDKLVNLVTFAKDKFFIDETVEGISFELDPEKFFKINRKFIVNIDSINNMTNLSRTRILLELKPKLNTPEAIVSIEKSKEFKEWLNV